MTGLAVVTGAAAGLGVGFADTLSVRGHPLLLVAQRADRVDALANGLRAHVAVETLAIDLAARISGALNMVMAEGTRLTPRLFAR
jgi:short-subunit dehydrogenase